MKLCKWPDCGAPLSLSDIDDDGRCRYCFGKQELSLDDMIEEMILERKDHAP